MGNEKSGHPKGIIETIPKVILPLIFSRLDEIDLLSVERCSATFFASAHRILIKRKLAEELKKALINRDLATAKMLLDRDLSLANVKSPFKANPYYDCPEILMDAYEFAYWLGDEPTKDMLKKKAKITQADDEKLNAMPKFNFSDIKKAVNDYVKDPNEQRREALFNALQLCPKFVLDICTWAYYENMEGKPALDKLDLWEAAEMAKTSGGLEFGPIATFTQLENTMSGSLYLFNRILSMRSHCITPQFCGA